MLPKPFVQVQRGGGPMDFNVVDSGLVQVSPFMAQSIDDRR